MKDYLTLIIGLICLCLSLSAWAQALPKTNTLEVQITGLPDQPLKNALLRITQQQQLIVNNFTPQNINRLINDIPSQIQTAIKPFGYFKATIRSHSFRKGNHWTNRFDVTAGPQLKFTSVSLSITGPGANDQAFVVLYDHFPVKAGDYFNAKKYEAGKQDLLDLASSLGYFDSRMVKSQLYINLDTYSARVVIHFDTGQRYRFGLTHFSKTPFNIKFLERFLAYKSGSYYDQRKIQRTRQGFANSNYFSTVMVIPKTNQAKNREIPVSVNLRTQPRKQYTIGLGYGTDTGPRGIAGIDLRWLNQWGHHLNAYIIGSQNNSRAVANYFIPGRNPSTDQYVFTGGFLNQNQTTGKGFSTRGAFSYQTILSGWQTTASLTVLRERYSITNLPFTDTNLVYPTFTFQRMRSNNPLNPSRGYNIVAQITGASNKMLSQTSFIQSSLDMRFLYTVFNNTRFLLRTTAGHTSIKNIINLPLSLQLFAGGAQSLRGYGYNTIGPGRNLFVGSVEIQERLFKGIYLAGFFDFGNVADKLSANRLHLGVGPGIVWISPIGVLEITVANAISQPNRPWVIQFSMGPAI